MRICMIIILGMLIEAVRAEGITIRRVEVQAEGDSLVVCLLLNLQEVEADRAEAFSFTPVLRAEGRFLELPPVVVSGKRRARADHRSRVLQPESGAVEPYCTLYNKEKKDSLVYRAAVPYGMWMNHASLVLIREQKDCCRMEILGIDGLLADLNLTNDFRIPQGGALAIAEKGKPIATNTVQGDRQEADANTVTNKTKSPCTPCVECTAMVSYLTPETETRKQRSESATLYIDYPTGIYDVRSNYHNNATELAKLDSLLSPLTEGNLAQISGISVYGYASPEGAYRDNEVLASNRAHRFEAYMHTVYPGLPHDLFRVGSVAEDWDGLVELLHQRPTDYSEKVLTLIARTGIFEGREKLLMDMEGGAIYKSLLKDYFPLLRRIAVTVGYEARAFSIEEAATLIYTHPRLLSLQEMYRVAAFYRPGTEQYREVYEIAAYHFPDDAVANINAASAVIMAGDPVTAYQYLNKVADDPRSWNDFGVLAYLEGDHKKAEKWFRKAIGVEPEKARKNMKTVMSD